MAASPVYKVIILGDNGVGKTTLFHRILFGTYLDTSNDEDKFNGRTISGLDCLEKTVNVLGEDIRVVLNDSQGINPANRFRTRNTNNLYRSTDAVLLLYSVEDTQTFESLPSYVDECRNNVWGLSRNDIVWALVGNKTDLHCEGMSPERLDDYCDTLRTNLNFTLSAKTGDNVKETFYHIVESLHEHKLKLSSRAGYEQRGSFTLAYSKSTVRSNCC